MPLRRHIKCVLIGDGGVGKTCLATTFAKGVFPSGYVPTTFDAHTVACTLPGGRVVELHVWDCAGQHEFDQVRHYAYFPTLDVFVLCFSLVSRVSLVHCERRWMREARGFDERIPVILVGTQLDARDNMMVKEGGGQLKRVISRREGQEVAARIGAVHYFEVSALQGKNVRKVFEAAARLGAEGRLEEEEDEEEGEEEDKGAVRRVGNGDQVFVRGREGAIEPDTRPGRETGCCTVQ